MNKKSLLTTTKELYWSSTQQKTYPTKIHQRRARQRQSSCWTMVLHRQPRQQKAQHLPGTTGSSRMSSCFVLVHRVRWGTQRCRWSPKQSEITPSPLPLCQSRFPWSRSKQSWSTSASLAKNKKTLQCYCAVLLVREQVNYMCLLLKTASEFQVRDIT